MQPLIRKFVNAPLGAAAVAPGRPPLLRQGRRVFLTDTSGAVGMVAALGLPVLIGASVLGTEVGYWAYKHRAMQGAADAGALSAVVSGYLGGSASDQAQAVTASRGFKNGVDGVIVQVNAPPTSGAYAGRLNAAEVIVQQAQSPMLAAFLSRATTAIRGRAVAIRKPGGACVLALNGGASGAITVQGTPQVTLNGCDAVANSANAAAIVVGGSANLSANAAVTVGGVSGANKITAPGGVITGATAVEDPYANRYFPSFSGCTQTYTGGNATLYPGVYCGGLAIGGQAQVRLNPGIYYMDGGPLKMTGQATLSGTGVTLVFTSSTGANYAGVSLTGGNNVDLTAPTDGPTQGIVVFGDRSMTLDTPFKDAGNGTQSWGGAIYIPRGALTYSGGAAANIGCTQIIADVVTFVGNSGLSNNCDGYGTTPIGNQIAVLVE